MLKVPPPPPPAITMSLLSSSSSSSNCKGLKLESLSTIDIATLSQSELLELSLTSPSAFDLNSNHDIVTPKIDRTLFNESAGSRRQTYSRPHKPQSTSNTTDCPTGHRRRVAGLIPTPKLPPVPADDPENKEIRVIIDYLKELIKQDPKFEGVELNPPRAVPISAAYGTNFEVKVGMGDYRSRGEIDLVRLGGERKRKRGRKPKLKVHLEECYRGMQMVNKNGVVVDPKALENAVDPFAEELRKRTVGLRSEEELLGFLRDLGGEWGSRRRRRKIVDASDFGDVLPVGWKLLLGIKRKDGNAWIYCRRYISPPGKQFISCKEAALYLQSLHGQNDTSYPISLRDGKTKSDNEVTPEYHVGDAGEDHGQRQMLLTSFTSPTSSLPVDHNKEVALLGIENLADVEIHDLFECHKCNMTFDDKDSYLQHLLSFHQRTTRRYRLGSSVGDGVIIRDGKFECQFCHKVFSERRRYNGHVGIHVRNFVRGVDESPDQTNVGMATQSPANDEPSSKISKMEALIEIAQNSILENSTLQPDNRAIGDFLSSELNLVSTKIDVCDLVHGINFGSTFNEDEVEDGLTDCKLDQDFSQPATQHLMRNENFEKLDDELRILEAKRQKIESLFIYEQNPSPTDDNHEAGNDVSATDCNEKFDTDPEGISSGKLTDQTVDQLMFDAENEINSTCTGSEKVIEVCTVNVKNDNEERYVDPKLDDVKTMDYDGADTAQESLLAATDVPIDKATDWKHVRVSDNQAGLANDNMLEPAHDSSVNFDTQDMLNSSSKHQLISVCVWCGIEFKHDTMDSDIQPGSVGFMCPDCKAKISGQINVLGGGSPICPDQL